MTDDDKKPDSPDPSIVQSHRRAALIRLMMENPHESSCRKLAERMADIGIDTSKATVARDMKSPDVLRAIRNALYNFLDMEVIHFAVENITHGVVVDGDKDDSKWLLDRLAFFPPKELRIGQIDSPGDLTAETIANEIREMFTPETLAALAAELSEIADLRPLTTRDAEDESGDGSDNGEL